MVGFEPTAQSHLSKTEHAVAGAFSGFVTRALLQPLDVLKIRFQLQVEPIRQKNLGSKYSGIGQAVIRIWTEEGPKAFWKGHVPAQGLSILYGLVQFSTFEAVTHWCWNAGFQSWTVERRPLVHFFCGAFSGCTATIAVHPLDVVRTRLVAQGEPKIYRGITEAVVKMYSHEGLWAFYKGLTPTLVAIGPYVGAQFGFYRFFQEMIDNFTVSNNVTASRNAVAGALAGLSAKALTYPLDLVKKRLQVQGFEEARKAFGQVRTYKGMRHCLQCVVKEEGLRGLFKGLSPSLLKAALATSCHMSIYEAACQILLERSF